MTQKDEAEARILAPYKLASAISRMNTAKAREVLCSPVGDGDETVCLLDPNMKDTDAPDAWATFRHSTRGSTFLHEAASLSSIMEGNGNNPAILLMLMSVGADIHAVNDFGNTALHEAAYCNNAVACAILIRAGANPNQQNAEGLTALHTSTRNGLVDACRLILALGGDPTITSDVGETPAEYATRFKNKEAEITIQVAMNRNAVLDLVYHKIDHVDKCEI